MLERLRLVLAAALLLAVAAGGLLGRLFANRALRPVADLTDAVEHVELTGDLSPRIAVDERGERDEVGRLAGRFNAMLGRLQTSRAELDASVDAQRRLVADASHELRTPVTSMRTNAEVLRAQPDLPAAQRGEILDDVVAQADELGLLVADLIELARDGEPPNAAEREDVRLDELVAEAVARARLPRAGTRDRRSDASPSSSRRTASASAARSTTCSTTPSSTAGRRAGRGARHRRRDGHRPRPRPGHPGRRARARLRPLLARRRRARAARLRASAWRSCGRSPRATAGRSRVEDGAGRRRAVPAALPVAA